MRMLVQNRHFRNALKAALAERDLAVALDNRQAARKVVIVRQSSGERVEPEDDGEEDESDAVDEEEEEELEEEEEEAPSMSINTQFLARMLRSLARTNERTASHAAGAPVPVPEPSLATRRARAEAQIQRLAAAVGLRVEVYTIDDEPPTASQPPVPPQQSERRKAPARLFNVSLEAATLQPNAAASHVRRRTEGAPAAEDVPHEREQPTRKRPRVSLLGQALADVRRERTTDGASGSSQ
jgi:hypothetical protein